MRLLTLLALVLTSAEALASFTIAFPAAASVNAGDAGFFDVVLTNSTSPPVGPFFVDSYNVQLSVPLGSGISLTGVTAGTNLPYLFAGNSLGIVAIPNGLLIDWNDLTAVPPAVVAPGTSFGLGRVFYQVEANTPIGVVPVTVNGITTFAEFPGFGAIPYTAGAGGLTVVTPAPPAFVLFAGSLLMLGIQRKRIRLRRN